jgi:phosphopantothenoylcysteine decarboxylase/phosphopantothenate--cysteine ligase
VRIEGKRVVVAMAGGIACYKAADLIRLLVQQGARVRVVMTRNAQEFITPLTLQALSGAPVATDTFDLTQESEIGHIRLADDADVIVVAPATANVIGKLAAGIADDLLTTVLIAARVPRLLAPAMNVHMFENPIVQDNLRRLRAVGYQIVGPASGDLACGYTGFGRLSEPGEILEEIAMLLAPGDLAGERILVTAGPSRESLDPVRFLSNRSSGRMGYAVARAARRRGAEVTLVSGPTSLPAPPGVSVLQVTTAREMQRAVVSAFEKATVVVMTAAVADYRPERTAAQKVAKDAVVGPLRLVRNPDILQELGRRKGSRLLVGFAAETHDVRSRATRKLRDKRLDLIVANDVTAPDAGFDVETNRVALLDARGGVEELPLLSKDEVAERLCDWIASQRRPRRGQRVKGASLSGRRAPKRGSR